MDNMVKKVTEAAAKALANATSTEEEALALEQQIRDALNTTQGKLLLFKLF